MRTHLESDAPKHDVPTTGRVPALVDGRCGHAAAYGLHNERYYILRVCLVLLYIMNKSNRRTYTA
jgi:hypothetical protein